MPQSQYTWIDDPHYSVRSMSEDIDDIPNVYGRLQELGLFTPKPIYTTYVDINIKNFNISLIPSKERYSPPTQNRRAKGRTRPLSIPHFPLDDQINADQLQNALRHGANGPWDFEVLDDLVGDVHDELSIKHFQTHEYLEWGALKGIVYDADGVTELVNIYDFMGVAQTVIDYKFGDDVDMAPIHKASARIVDHLAKNSGGDIVRGAHCFCGRGFFDRLVTHPEVREAYLHYASLQDPNRGGVTTFYHKQIMYEVQVGEAIFNNPDGTFETRPFVGYDEGIIVPLGTQQTFRKFCGPATGLKNVNKKGQLLYSRILPDPSGRDDFVSVDTQSNIMPMVLRPKLVLKVHSST